MLGNGRLGDAELALDDGGNLPGRMLSVDEQFQDAPPHGVAEHLEGVHQAVSSGSPV